jgi:hypothetical protein
MFLFIIELGSSSSSFFSMDNLTLNDEVLILSADMSADVSI